jgi:hypothetical protein
MPFTEVRDMSSAAKTGLGTMNKQLKRLLRLLEWRASMMEILTGLVEDLKSMKEMVLRASFDDLFGLPFFEVYIRLYRFMKWLWKAKDAVDTSSGDDLRQKLPQIGEWLEQAESAKRELEEYLRTSPRVPRGLRDGLREANEKIAALRRLLGMQPPDLEAIRSALVALFRFLMGLIQGVFPEMAGHSFWDWFVRFGMLDFDLDAIEELLKEGVLTPEPIKKLKELIESAKRTKKTIEGMLPK